MECVRGGVCGSVCVWECVGVCVWKFVCMWEGVFVYGKCVCVGGWGVSEVCGRSNVLKAVSMQNLCAFKK